MYIASVYSLLTGNAEVDHADEYRSLFGVRLASEIHLKDRMFDTCLGIIVLGSDWSNLLLPAIRVEICRQLHAVSNSFTFLTSEGFVGHMTTSILAFISNCVGMQHSKGTCAY